LCVWIDAQGRCGRFCRWLDLCECRGAIEFGQTAVILNHRTRYMGSDRILDSMRMRDRGPESSVLLYYPLVAVWRGPLRGPVGPEGVFRSCGRVVVLLGVSRREGPFCAARNSFDGTGLPLRDGGRFTGPPVLPGFMRRRVVHAAVDPRIPCLSACLPCRFRRNDRLRICSRRFISKTWLVGLQSGLPCPAGIDPPSDPSDAASLVCAEVVRSGRGAWFFYDYSPISNGPNESHYPTECTQGF